MAMVGTTVVLPTVAPLSAPTRFLFDAVGDLLKMYLNDKWAGSINFCALPVYTPMVGLPLTMMSIVEVDICDYLGWSSLHSFVGRLYLDPEKYDKPPVARESLVTNPHWMQLKIALQLAAQTSGSPVVCNGGRDNRTFQCKLHNRLYRPPLGKKEKKDNAPRQDDCINMDKDGRRSEGRSQSKRTRTTKALTSDKHCSFKFTVKWDFYGFYVTVEKTGFGYPNHENHIKGDLSKCSLPMQLIPDKEKEII
jgi:hypothetical protein